MTIVSTGYTNTGSVTSPSDWLERISFYTGILERLAKTHLVHSIEQIDYSGRLRQKDVEYHFLNLGNRTPLFPKRLHQYIHSLNPDVVLINGFIFPFQLIQLARMLRNHVKIFVFNRAEKPLPGFRIILQHFADKYIDGYFFNSANMAGEWIRRGVTNSSKIFEVAGASSSFQPFDRAKARLITGVSGNPVFLWVANLDNNKDPLTVLIAFQRYVQVQPAARLYMIYQNDQLLQEVAKMLDKHHDLKNSVTLVGTLSHDSIQDWYNSADFFISASHSESIGIAAIEAMSCGCIPILSAIDSFKKLTGPGNCGYLFSPGDSNALFSLLHSTIEMDLSLERERSLRQFREKLSFAAVASRLNEIISGR